MNQAQGASISVLTARELRVQKNFNIIIVVLTLLHFFFNFTGIPLLRPLYIVEITIVLVAVCFMPLDRVLPGIFMIFFFEGQGRIIGNYNIVVRVIFDLLLLFGILKSFAVKKRLFNLKIIPLPIIVCIILHICWFMVQLFNTKNVGFLSALYTSKIYIFPMLLFFTLVNNPFDIKSRQTRFLQYYLLGLSFLQCLLVIFQMQVGAESLISHSSYYTTAMGDFVGKQFRPFGTSFGPGTISPYFFLTVGFAFIYKFESIKKQIFYYVIIGFTWFPLVILQVRSALVKHIFVLLFIHIGLFSFSRKKFRGLSIFLFAVFISLFSIKLVPDLEKIFPDMDLETAFERVESLGNIQDVKSGRMGPSFIMSKIESNLKENPLGLGPGRQGPVKVFSESAIRADPVYGIEWSWAFDNLFLSLAIDLGYGMIFYLLVIILVPLYLFKYTVQIYRRGDSPYFYPILAAASVTLVTLIGNWGAVGIPYNPESFGFWFWCSVGFSQWYLYNQKTSKAINDDQTDDENEESFDKSIHS